MTLSGEQTGCEQERVFPRLCLSGCVLVFLGHKRQFLYLLLPDYIILGSTHHQSTLMTIYLSAIERVPFHLSWILEI